MFQKKQFSFKESSKNNFPKIFHWYFVFLIVLTAFVFLMVCEPLLSQEAQKQEEKEFTITFKSRKFIPTAGIEKNVLSKFEKIITQEKKMPHIIIQFKRAPTRKKREYLKARGIKLLSYIGGNAWFCTLSEKETLRFTIPEIVKKYPTLELIRSISEVLPDYKIHPSLKTKEPGPWAVTADGRIKLSIDFFKDISSKQARELLAKYDAEIESERTRRISFYIIVTPDRLNLLAQEDSVKFIDVYPPPKKEFNDGSRAWTNTNAVHAEVSESNASITIEGNGTILGIWDGNEVDAAHDDLGARVTFGEVPRTNITSDHSTHVAGTMAGNGTNNFNLRGHAPQSDEIVSYDFSGDVPAEMEQAIEDHDIIAANNSWGYIIGWDWGGAGVGWVFNNNQNLFGDYIGECPDLDDLVRNEKLLIVFAAGNDRNDRPGASVPPAPPADWDQGVGNNGYDTLAPPATAKNIITIGAINDATGAMSAFSNWGPTDDGRIKPDVVAPGVAIESCDDNPDDGYDIIGGTSMAAPAVTGISALLLQTYRDEFFGDVNSDEVPLPSTIKASLIHSAQELGNPGPDFIFGWGGVDAQAAYNLIRSRLVIESQLTDTGKEDVFLVDVSAGETEFNVTICWDDVYGDHLINDLDLSLEAPDGTVHLPWVLNPAPGNWANNAATGIDHTNNCEQVHVVNPQQGLWKIKIAGFGINEPTENPIQKYSLVSDFPFYESESVSVIQVIDRTGSMRHRDEPSAPSYMKSAKTAAQNFIGLMKMGDEVGVVAFDDEGCDNIGTKAEARFNLVEITNETVRNNAISSIDPLNHRGCTSIGAGMQLAQEGPNFLETATADQPHAMVLLTDGFENTAPWVSGILPNIPAETDIYTISLGSSADSDLMKDIADTTGAKFYESPTILGLLSVYYQIQGDLELAEMADLETGSKGSGNDTRVVTVDQGTSEATFVIGWLQTKGDLKLTLKNPNGETITVNGPNVKEGHGSTYYFLRIKDPLPGNWEVHILRTDSGTFQVDYTFTVFIKGASKLWSFIPDFTLTGDCLMTKLKLYDNRTLEPITGASIKAIISSPKTYKYTLNFNYVNPRDSKWRPPLVISPDFELTRFANPAAIGDKSPTWASTLLYYDQKSRQETGESIFQYDITEVVLFDDGTQGDEQAGDGTYTNCIDKTQIAGSYNIRFSISGVTPAGANFKRKMLSTASIKPSDVDPEKTLVRVDPYVIDVKKGSGGIITIVPLDCFGNVWGSHFAPRISVSATAGALSGELRDNGDGFYFQILKSTGVEGTGEVIVTIDGVEIETRPVVWFKEVKYPFSFSIHSGLATPIGSFANDFDPGINALLNLDYHFSPQLSLVALLGYNAFKSKTAGVEDTYWINVSANMKYRSHTGALSPYFNGGLGYYIPKTGSSGFGINLGVGYNYNYNNFLTFEVGADYHKIFDKDVQFLHGHAGVIFRF